MPLREYLKENEIETPAFYFDLDVFGRRIDMVKRYLPETPLTFSVKANPFLLWGGVIDSLDHIEVCSPGELEICRSYGIPGTKIIYSGVNKEHEDVKAALEYGVDILTAESIRHVQIGQAEAARLGKKQKTILRLSSGNQFGMSAEDILFLLGRRKQFPNLLFYGLHHYSGTQNKLRRIEADITSVSGFLEKAKENMGFTPELVEMGPGLAVDYFQPPYDKTEEENLSQAAPLLRAFAARYPLGIEMGRFLAAPCGTYATRVKDIKHDSETEYVICDGGTHHLKYHGQTLAMQIPEMEVARAAGGSSERETCCLCGSLCTTADVLVREASLPALRLDDVLLFHRCGAYSVTEGSTLFLSREIPAVYLYSEQNGIQKVRERMSTARINRSCRCEGSSGKDTRPTLTKLYKPKK